MVPYKKIDLIIETFKHLPDHRLKVIGSGPDMKKIKAVASPNVEIMGYVPDEIMRQELAKARAYVFAAEADFGIVPIEAQAAGTPVIAFGKGGALETVTDGVSGCFFEEQTVESLLSGIKGFLEQENTFDAQEVRQNAMKFGVDEFRTKLQNFVDEKFGTK